MNKPFVVLKLVNVYPAHRDEITKGFYANFRLIFCYDEKKILKHYDFNISGESYQMLSYLDKIVSGIKVDAIDIILKEIEKDIFDNVTEFPINISKSGKDYDWYLLSKMIEISEKC